MKSTKGKSVLVSGAGFAGLSTAYWMNRLGYEVTVVEIAKGLKKGGSPVNIEGDTVGIVKRMGLLDQIQANNIITKVMEFVNNDNIVERSVSPANYGSEPGREEYQIERDILLSLLFDSVKEDVRFIFGNGIASMKERDQCMEVSFRGGQSETFDLVIGCDGNHSAVRRCWFGEEDKYSHFLQAYFSISIVDKLLIRENTLQMYSEPGKTVMLNTYNNKTDIVLCFFSEEEIPYDYRNENQQRKLMLDKFADSGWRTSELLKEVMEAERFYFDKLCQIKMPSWTKDRVALVGDAGYCASPAAGKGGSLAIDGAAALADAFRKHNGRYEPAFREYNESLRAYIEDVQANAKKFGLEMLFPRTEAAIRERNGNA